MPTRKLFALALAAVAAFVAAGLAAPGPKDTPPAKVPEGGVPVEPADGDAEKQHNTSANNLKQLALATINYADANKGRLPTDIVDKDGKPLLSWRIELLPYIEQDALSREFKRDQPWDSEHNKKLLARMPKVFESPRVKVKAAGHTVYQGFNGPGALFETGKPRIFPAHITDGTSNTIFAIEASVAVPWTKPMDLPFDEKKDLPELGKGYGSKPLAALCDGSVRKLDMTTLTVQTLKAAITISGGEVLGADW
jgi:hypothetical protein